MADAVLVPHPVACPVRNRRLHAAVRHASDLDGWLLDRGGGVSVLVASAAPQDGPGTPNMEGYSTAASAGWDAPGDSWDDEGADDAFPAEPALL